MVTNREIYDAIAQSWYRLRHRCRFSSELAEVSRRWKDGRLLNVGCAHGPDFLPFKATFELYGVDFSVKMLALVQKYADKFDFKVDNVLADAQLLPFSSHAFDYAIAVATYHHIAGRKERQNALLELNRVLRPGGEAFITVWNKWQSRFLLNGKDVPVAWNTGEQTLYRYYHLYSYKEFRQDLRNAGFTIITIEPEKSFRFPIKYFSKNICALVKKG